VWEAPTMNATITDDRRRLVMPPELPPKSAVTVQQIDADTWLVKRHQPDKKIIMLLLPQISRLPDDPAWEAVEKRMARHHNKKLPRFKE
jgi:hypothetical protein